MRTYERGQFLRHISYAGVGTAQLRATNTVYYKVLKVSPATLLLVDEVGRNRRITREFADKELTIAPADVQIPASLRMYPQTPPTKAGEIVTVLSQVVSVGGTPTLNVNPVVNIKPGSWVRLTVEVLGD